MQSFRKEASKKTEKNVEKDDEAELIRDVGCWGRQRRLQWCGHIRGKAIEAVLKMVEGVKF